MPTNVVTDQEAAFEEAFALAGITAVIDGTNVEAIFPWEGEREIEIDGDGLFDNPIVSETTVRTVDLPATIDHRTVVVAEGITYRVTGVRDVGTKFKTLNLQSP